MRINYYTYIHSDEWRRRATEAKKRAGNRCQICNRSASQVTLDAHHRTYDRLGHEDPGDITVLCRDCHELYEQNKKLPQPPQYAPTPIVPPAPVVKTSYQPPSTSSVVTISSYQTAKPQNPAPTSINLGAKTILPIRAKKQRSRLGSTIAGVVFTIFLLLVFITNFSPKDNVHNKLAPTTNSNSSAAKVVTKTATPVQVQATTAKVTRMFDGPGNGATSITLLAAHQTLVIFGYTKCGTGIWYQIGKDWWIESESITDQPDYVPYVDKACVSANQGIVLEAVPLQSVASPAAYKTPNETETKIYGMVNRGANIRQGPGTGYPVARTITKGKKIPITGYTPCESGIWYELAAGEWIAGYLVDDVSGEPLVIAAECKFAEATATPMPPAPTKTRIVISAPRLAAPPAAVASDCDTSYPDVCIPPAPPDLDCGQIPYRRFRVVGADPHRLDGDGDGVGCES